MAALGRTLTPIFHPMGITDDNWPATVGIFTGIFAKEVVVGTLDALYTGIANGADAPPQEPFEFTVAMSQAAATVPENLRALVGQIGDPLGINIGDLSDVVSAAEDQAVTVGTIDMLRGLFDGDLGAFSYLLFILLYIPCAAVMATIYKEIGPFWAVFGTCWSIVMAYTLAVIFYQAGHLLERPLQSSLWCLAMLAAQALCFAALIYWGRTKVRLNLIPVTNL
jgi:ferrous iron transport protein B